MRHQYTPPALNKSSFNCVHCGAFAQQVWMNLVVVTRTARHGTNGRLCRCSHCGGECYWVGEALVWPSSAPVEQAHPDMPPDCASDYIEARSVFSLSPRSSAALIRLAIQKLMANLGQSGKNINSDIKALVEKGLSRMVQQALDVCRVVGNNAVHPGELDLNDTPEVAHSLFRLINVIVEEMIAKPREIQAIYDALPMDALSAIAKRDAPPSNKNKTTPATDPSNAAQS